MTEDSRAAAPIAAAAAAVSGRTPAAGIRSLPTPCQMMSVNIR